jgi:hypothetical protein
MDHAKKLIKGVKRKKFYPKEHKWAGRAYYEVEHDSATLRFLIERFFPPAKVSMDINMKSGFEKLIKILRKKTAGKPRRRRLGRKTRLSIEVREGLFVFAYPEITYRDFSRLAKKRGWRVEMLVELRAG